MYKRNYIVRTKQHNIYLTPQTHILKYDQVSALYNALNFEIIYLDTKYYQMFQKKQILNSQYRYLSKELWDKLFELRFVSYIENDCSLLNSIQERIRSRFLRPKSLVLSLSGKCNLNCDYCVVMHNLRITKYKKLMDEKVAQKAVDIFGEVSTKDEQKNVIFWGGEPLLNFKIMEKVVNIVNRNFGSLAKFTIITNGLICTKNIIDLVVKNNIFVIVSLDGLSSDSNWHRFHGNEILRKKVIANYLEILNAGVEVGLSSVICPSNIERLKDEITLMGLKLKPSSLGLGSLHCGPLSNDTDLNLSADKLIECFDVLRTYGIYIEHAMRRVRPFVFKIIRHRDCPATGGALKVLPNGDVTLCDNFGLQGLCLLGNVLNDKTVSIIENPVMWEWSNLTQLNKKQCHRCEAFGLCGGGCPYDAFNYSGSLEGRDIRTCIISKKFVNWLIWDLWKSIKRNYLPLLKRNQFVIPKSKDRRKILGSVKENPFQMYCTFGEIPVNEENDPERINIYS